MSEVTVVGGGLAANQTPALAELVCTNSYRTAARAPAEAAA